MPKWFKTFLAILLLPVCVGAARTLWKVLLATGDADTFWVALLAGAGCWLSIYLLLPKPLWLYVFGHELTHVLWTWLHGGKVKKFKASSKGGHVVVTKSSFLIALAPYFFPIYAVFLVILFLALTPFYHLPILLLHLLLGAAYAFHLTLTWHILKHEQSDITEHGYLFSLTIIFLGNVCVLLVALPLLTGKIQLVTVAKWWGEFTAAAVLGTIRAMGN